MAGEREEWIASEGQVRTVDGEFIASCWENEGAFGPSREVERASKIACEHNLHWRLVDGLKMALAEMRQITGPVRSQDEMYACRRLGAIIAEAEKE